jgi:flagellar assembly protein FliH
MDGGYSAAFEATEGLRAGHGPVKGTFVSQPGLTAPESRAGFQVRTPAALVVHLREPEPAAPPPIIIEPEPPEAAAPPPVQQTVMPRPVSPPAAQLAETRAIALAEGRALGIADAEAALRGERDSLEAQARAFAAALARLAEPPVAEVDGLIRSISAAVARLASDRAGLAIDTMPDPFARRIARLAERVAQGMRDVSVHLHPDDLAAIGPLLSAACPPELSTLAAARLVADPSLSRGDADLRAPGMRLADLSDAAAPRPTESPAP